MTQGRKPMTERNDAIRHAVAGGVSQRALAGIFSLSTKRISQIVAAPAKAEARQARISKSKAERTARLDRAFAEILDRQ